MKSEFTETGKVPDEFFKEHIYPYCGSVRKEVRTGPRFGTDVSMIELPNGMELALTSDPLSYIPSLGLMESAWLSVHLLANDMATTGVAPQYAQFVLNLPETVLPNALEEYWKHIHTICENIGVAITGGHTGRFPGINTTIAGGGTMAAVAQKGVMLSSQGAKPGDALLVTKQSALIATSILARSFPETVKNKCGEEVQKKACELFFQTSCLQEGLIAASCNANGNKKVTAMHDVTECGILGAIYEMAKASDCGVEINYSTLPVGEVQKSICSLFEINPLFCVGAGSMIIAVSPSAVEDVCSALRKNNISVEVVGKCTPQERGCIIRDGERVEQLIHPGTDPYWNAYFTALNKGLR